MGPSSAGASRAVTKMAVGPSAPPMMPMALDSCPVKHKAAADKRDKNTELRRRAQQQALGIGDEGAEVRHGANAHENKAGINTQLHTEVEDVHQSRADRYVREGHAVVGRSLLRLHQRLQLCAKGGNTVCGRRDDLRYGAADRLRGEHGLRGGHELLQIWREHIFRHALIVKLR